MTQRKVSDDLIQRLMVVAEHLMDTRPGLRERNVGNCLNEYTCKKCDRGYTVDSSG